MSNVITLTETAEKKLLETFKDENKTTDTHHLRVGVASGGCSGLQYYMEIHKKSERDETDNTTQFNDIEVVVDKQSFFYLLGSQLDFSSGLNGKGFEWSNPNASRSCGCGESFSL
jgi:iron-sulfur cluster assembly protein